MQTTIAKQPTGVSLVLFLGLLALGVAGAVIGLSVFAIVAILIIPAWVLLGSRIGAEVDYESGSWLDAWIKTAVIFVGAVVLGVFVPSYILEVHSIATLSSTLQDVVGTGAFSIALVFSLWAIYRAHVAKRI